MTSLPAVTDLEHQDDAQCGDDGRGPMSAKWIAAVAVLLGATAELVRTLLS